MLFEEVGTKSVETFLTKPDLLENQEFKLIFIQSQLTNNMLPINSRVCLFKSSVVCSIVGVVFVKETLKLSFILSG